MSTSLELFFQDLQNRGVIANVANLEENFYQLKPEEKVIYLGIDCTAESLHIGHLFLLLQTVRFAKEGFKVLLVLGGATSKIGDPSDKLKERPQLEDKKINQYYQAIKNQITRIVTRPPTSEIIKEISFSPLELFCSDSQELANKLDNIYEILEIKKQDGAEKKWEKYLSYIWPLKEDKFEILNNDNWLGKLTLIDFNKIGQNISVNYLLNKETIKHRIEDPTNSLSFLAFSYSLLQAYDFYYLYQNYNCRGQLGGSDQWGNLTTGLKLIRGFYPENKTFAFTCKLLTNKEGEKFSKSENGKKTLRLNDKKEDLVDFFLNLSDEETQIFIRQFTFLEEKQIEELSKTPPKLRIFQRILVELIYWLNYREINSLKNILEIRGEKVSFFTDSLLGWWKKKRKREIGNEAMKIWEKLLREERELREKIWLLRLLKNNLESQRSNWETGVEKIEEDLNKAEINLSELEHSKDKIFNIILLKYSQ